MKKFNNKPNTCIKQDGKEYWISRSCAVNAMIFFHSLKTHDDYLLIVKRGKGAADYVGKYCLPCGYIDYNETGYEAFLREVYEETGLDMEKYENKQGNKIINNEIQPYLITSNPSNNRQNISLYYLFAIGDANFPKTSLENNEPDEIDEAIWVKVEDIDNYEFCFGHKEKVKEFHYNLF